VAVDHNPDITLTRHRFSRSGDLWKHALPRLRRKPIAFEIFGLLNVERVWQRGSYRVAIACPYCGALTLTADDTYAIRFSGGGVNDHSGVNDRPQQAGCLACGRGLDVTDLLENWKARDLDRLLTKGPLVAYCPRPQTFIVDEPEPGKFWIGLTVYDALHRHVGPVFPLTRRLSRIEAMNREHAMTLVGQHHASMTWRDVAITGELEPEDPAWHGGPLAVWERQKLDNRKHALRRKKREALDAEIEAVRRQRAAELGI
jgi:hypothetical protein